MQVLDPFGVMRSSFAGSGESEASEPPHATPGAPDAEVPEGTLAQGNILLNEGALRRFGFGTPEASIGREILVGLSEDTEAMFTVVGVIADMHFQSLKSVKRPEMYFMHRLPTSNLLVRYTGDPVEIAAA